MDPQKANSLVLQAEHDGNTFAVFLKKMMQEKPLASSDQEKQDDSGAGADNLGKKLPAEAVLDNPPFQLTNLPRTSLPGAASMLSKMGAHDLSKVT
jgi:hypothetical protein